jgi:hypothetical protein
MGFPDDLPDLRALRPPQGNDHPEAAEQSWLMMRERGELPDVYWAPHRRRPTAQHISACD